MGGFRAAAGALFFVNCRVALAFIPGAQLFVIYLPMFDKFNLLRMCSARFMRPARPCAVALTKWVDRP